MIVTARKLVLASPRRPRQAELKRAISTAYYALFQAIAKEAADLLVGKGAGRPNEAWVRVYRSLQHGEAKTACEELRRPGVPSMLQICAHAFVTLQEQRHAADYDPTFRVSRDDALAAVDTAEQAIATLRAAPRKDRLAFAVHLLHRRRR